MLVDEMQESNERLCRRPTRYASTVERASSKRTDENVTRMHVEHAFAASEESRQCIVLATDRRAARASSSLGTVGGLGKPSARVHVLGEDTPKRRANDPRREASDIESAERSVEVDKERPSEQ